MQKKLSLLLLLVFFFPANCAKDSTTGPGPQFPEVKSLQLPVFAYLDDQNGILVHAEISDPQGIQDIGTVQLLIRNPSNIETELTMHDDGKDGDIIADDGQFVARIAGSTWQVAGKGAVAVSVLDAAGNQTQSDYAEIEIISGAPGQPPSISSVTFPDTVWLDTRDDIQLLVSANDADGLADLDSIGFAFYPPYFPNPALAGKLSDDGLVDDGIAGNGIFGKHFNSSALGVRTGLYVLRVQAVDHAGNASEAVLATFVGVNRTANGPPVILSVSAPDTISRSVGSQYVLRAVVNDPNGLDDIDRVFFNTFLPNGSPSSGNPFFMRNDGEQGDTTSDDDEYALTITISSANVTGSYRFEFQASDRSGLLSQKVDHIITVIP